MENIKTIEHKANTDIADKEGNKANTADKVNYKSRKYECPICDSKELTMRYEASYIYSYVIDNDAPGLMNSDEFLSYLYDKRELKESRTYIECNHCGTQYPPTFLNEVLTNEHGDIKERAFR